ncbi:reverse transcriptase domain-containing protein [Tanacetum coccineum]
MILELADQTISTPTGIAKDVFVKVRTFFFPADFMVVNYVANSRVPLILGRPFLRTARALIYVYGEQITLRHDDQSVTFKVGDTKTFSYNIIESVNRVDVIDIACEEYVQEVLEISKSGNPTSTLDLMINSRSPSFTPTPFGGSDFLIEEIDEFIEHDDSIPPGVDGIYDSDGDTVYLEELLSVIINDPNLHSAHHQFRATQCADKVKSFMLKILPTLNSKITIHLDPWLVTGMASLHRLPKTQYVLVKGPIPIAIMDQMLEMLAGMKNFLICRMPFGYANATGKFQRCMVAIFHDMIEKTMEPMTHLLEKETPFIFLKECIEAFETLKMKLTQAPILVAPDWDLPFEIMCDASDFAVGAVLGAKKLLHLNACPVDPQGDTTVAITR